jgi:drug/metabolite transporter (DMT)-like permease
MKSYLYINAATIAMAMEYILLKATGTVSPYFTGLVIFSTAGILLYLGAGRQQKCPENIRSMLPWALLVGVIGSCCNFLWISGTRMTSAANASTLGRLDVVFTLVLSGLLFRETIPLRVWPFIGLSMIGVWLISGWEHLDAVDGMTGNILITAAAFMLSLNSFIIKKASGRLGAMRLAAINCGINAAVFGAVWLFSGDASGLLNVSVQNWLALLACGFCSFVFFSGYYTAVRELPVWEVRLIALTAPLFTVLCGWLLLGETISLQNFTGILLLLVGSAALVVLQKLKLTNKQRIYVQGVQ